MTSWCGVACCSRFLLTCNLPMTSSHRPGQAQVIIRPIKATTTITTTTVTTTTTATTTTSTTTTATATDTNSVTQTSTQTTTTIEGHDFHTVHTAIALLRKDLTAAQELIAAQQDLLATLLKPVAVPAGGGKGAAAAAGCGGANAAACNPSVAVVEGAGAKPVLEIKALGGGVTFETEQCAATDLCEMARKVEALLQKFDAN